MFVTFEEFLLAAVRDGVPLELVPKFWREYKARRDDVVVRSALGTNNTAAV